MADFTDDVAVTLTADIESYEGPSSVNLQFDVVTYVNRVWDTVEGGHVRWDTTGEADPSGDLYPGPGTFGVNTSNYCVESRR